MITIVFTHPWHGSFNHAILDAITHKLDNEELPYQIIDLSAEKFNPAMTTDDLRLYSKGETTDPLVQKYKKMLQHTDELIFIFPIWWGMLPASLKGFFDKVLLRGSAFNYDKNGNMIPGLKISRSLIITTSQGETEIYRSFMEGYLIPYLLNAVGICGNEWHNCQYTSHGPQSNREDFLKRIVELV